MYKLSTIGFIFLLFCSRAEAINSQLFMETANNSHWDKYSTEKLKALSEDEPTDYHGLGLLYLAHDELNQALEFFKQSTKDESRYYQAYTYYKLKDYDNSIKHINTYIKNNKNTSAYSLIVHILNDSGEHLKLSGIFKEIKKHNLYTPTIRYKKAMYDLSEGECQSAIDNFKLILKNTPKATVINNHLAQAYRQCNKAEEANNFFAKDSSGPITDNDPLLVKLYEYGNPALLLKPKLQNLLKEKKHEEALKVLKKLITIQANNENIWIQYGRLLKLLKNTEQAIYAFETAYELNNTSEIILENLIKINMSIDEVAANDWIDKLLLINPQHIIALRVKGDYLLSKGNTDEAIDYYKKALEINPEYIAVLLKLSKVYIKSNNKDEAIELFETSFTYTKNNIQIANYLARILMISYPDDSKINERALRIARKIFELKQDYTNKFTLLMALRLNKIDEEAEQYFNELVAIPLKPSQNKLIFQLDDLKKYSTFKKSLNIDWLW